MRILPAIALLVALSLGAGARADQTDPRLPELFDRLKAEGDRDAAQRIEITIWAIWSESDDQAVTLLLRDGLAAMSRRDYRAALGKFDQIVKIAPDFAEGWNKRATVNYLVGNYTASLHDIERTLALEPRHFGALSGRGLVYAELQEAQQALDSFEAALAIHPHLPGAQVNASALRKLLGDKDI